MSTGQRRDILKRIGESVRAKAVQKKLQRVDGTTLWLVRSLIERAGSTERPAIERFRAARLALDILALLLAGVKGRRYAELVSRKCGLSDVTQDTDIGEYILAKTYEDSDSYFAERLELLQCLAEAAFAIIMDARIEEMMQQ